MLGEGTDIVLQVGPVARVLALGTAQSLNLAQTIALRELV